MKSLLIAFCYGLRDGWEQPYELSSTRNVEHLPGDLSRNQEALDRGATWGQRLRSPFHHQKLNGE